MSTKYCVVYNSSGAPIEVDPETGRQVLPGEFAAVQRSVVKEYIDNDALNVTDFEIGPETNPNARAAKEECDRLTAEWEAEKSAAVKAEEKASPTSDYDDSSSKTTKGATRGSKSTN